MMETAVRWLKANNTIGSVVAYLLFFIVIYTGIWTAIEPFELPPTIITWEIAQSRVFWHLILTAFGASHLTLILVIYFRNIRLEAARDEFIAKQTDIHREIDAFDRTTSSIDHNGKVYLLNKIGQNLLALAAMVSDTKDPNIFTNLMIYDEPSRSLRMVLTHGFYYSKSFHRVFPVDGKKHEGSCGKAFRQNGIFIIDDVFSDDRVFSDVERKFENVGSLINIPIKGLGVLNIDCPQLNAFVPHEMYQTRLEVIQEVAAKYLKLYFRVNSLRH